MLYVFLAVAPAIAIILYIYYRDKQEKEPVLLLIRAFFFGLLSIIPAAYLEMKFVSQSSHVLAVFYSTFFVIAGAEEGCKYLFMYWAAYRKKAFNEPFDGIVYCVMVGMGFAAGENIMYVLRSDNPMNTAIMRMLTAVPAHATFAVIMGYYTGLAKFSQTKSWQYTVMAIGGAVLFHGFYDFCLMQQEMSYIALGAFVSLVVAIRLSWKALRRQSETSREFMEQGGVLNDEEN